MIFKSTIININNLTKYKFQMILKGYFFDAMNALTNINSIFDLSGRNDLIHDSFFLFNLRFIQIQKYSFIFIHIHLNSKIFIHIHSSE